MCASRLLGMGGHSFADAKKEGQRCRWITPAGLHGWLPDYFQNVSVLYS